MFVCILYVVNLVFINQMDRVMLIRGKYTLVQKSNYFIYIFHSKCLLFTLKVVIFHLLLKFKTSKNNIFMLFGVGSNGRKILGTSKRWGYCWVKLQNSCKFMLQNKVPTREGKALSGLCPSPLNQFWPLFLLHTCLVSCVLFWKELGIFTKSVLWQC